jgi:hypothetical protein
MGKEEKEIEPRFRIVNSWIGGPTSTWPLAGLAKRMKLLNNRQ